MTDRTANTQHLLRCAETFIEKGENAGGHEAGIDYQNNAQSYALLAIANELQGIRLELERANDLTEGAGS